MTTNHPSLRSANWLYLMTMALILSVGSFLQSRSIGWGLLVTEFGLILLPTLLFIWLGRQSSRAVLRLRWPGVRLVLLGIVIGAGVWGLDMGLQGLAISVLGYAPQSATASMPADPLSLVVFASAMAIAAPLCEEVLFRGYLLSAYSRFRPKNALVAVALLFAFYHMQFSGLVALLPIALVLSLLAYRSHSLLPGIAAHFANNSLGALVAISVRLNPALTNSQAFTLTVCSATLVGPVVLLAALWAYLRLTRPSSQDAPAPVAPPAAAAAPSGRGAFWPLAGAAAIYIVVAGLELIFGRFPQVLAAHSLELEPAPWSRPVRLAYNLWSVENERVGGTVCKLTPQAGIIAFDCVTRQSRFEAWQGQSLYAGGRYELRQTGQWDAATMRLLSAQLEFDGEYNDWSAQVQSGGSGLTLRLDAGAPSALPDDAVLSAEWPLRLMALPFGRRMYFGSQFQQVLLGASAATGQLEGSVAFVKGQEELLTPPSGEAEVWRLQVGPQIAWYQAETPHTLLRYYDGFGVTWTVDRDSLEDAGD